MAALSLHGASMPDDKHLFPHWPVQAAFPGDLRLGMRTILVVDDNPEVAAVTAELLAEIGHEAEIVHGGAEAIEAVARLRPDVVLLDIGMPGMDGYEVAARLRADRGANPEMVIIGVTGWGTEGHQARAGQAGFDKFWSKPVTLSELLSL
jgi:CheY-like chemotaxis protein